MKKWLLILLALMLPLTAQAAVCPYGGNGYDQGSFTLLSNGYLTEDVDTNFFGYEVTVNHYTLCLHGHSVTIAKLSLGENGALTVCDCTGRGGTLEIRRELVGASKLTLVAGTLKGPGVENVTVAPGSRIVAQSEDFISVALEDRYTVSPETIDLGRLSPVEAAARPIAEFNITNISQEELSYSALTNVDSEAFSFSLNTGAKEPGGVGQLRAKLKQDLAPGIYRVEIDLQAVNASNVHVPPDKKLVVTVEIGSEGSEGDAPGGEEDAPSSGVPGIPETGDPAMPMMWAGMLAAAVAILRKRK